MVVQREHMQPDSLVHDAAPVRVVDAHAAVDVVAGGIDRANLVLLRHRRAWLRSPASHSPIELASPARWRGGRSRKNLEEDEFIIFFFF